jgi:hypothetical protein
MEESLMKRIMILLVGAMFLLSANAFAAQKAATKAAKGTHMSAMGKITALTDTGLTLERTVKKKTESTEFMLEKPLAKDKFKVGEIVKVKYVEKDGKKIAEKVYAHAAKKAKKKK